MALSAQLPELPGGTVAQVLLIDRIGRTIDLVTAPLSEVRAGRGVILVSNSSNLTPIGTELPETDRIKGGIVWFGQ